MKILHVIPSVGSARGGSSKAALDMVNALVSININCEIACTDDNGDEQLTDVKLNKLTLFQGVPIRIFKKNRSNINAINEFNYSRAFKNWLKNHIANYDIVHVHGLFSYCSTYAMRLARKHGIKYIAHPIGHLEQWSLSQSLFRKKLYLQLFELKNLQQASRVHFTAQSEADRACKVVPGIKPLIVQLGLEIPELQPMAKNIILEKWSLTPDIPIIVFLARIHQKKGLETLLNALSKIPKNYYQLLIAGNGNQSYLNELKALTQNLKIQDHCHFLGYIDGEEKNQLLQAADLFTLTSYSENFGIAVLEALANETPVLVTNGVALSKEVTEYDLGFTCEMNVESVSNRLNEVLPDTTVLREKGMRARKYAQQNHKWSDLAKQLKQCYQTILIDENS